MQPTSMERVPRACKARTASMAPSLLLKKKPAPSTLMVQGQGRTRLVKGSSRPLSTRDIAGISVSGMRGTFCAAAMAASQAA